MIISDPMFVYLLVISNAALLAAGCIAILRFQEQRREFEKFWSSPTGTTLGDNKDEGVDQLVQMNRQLEKQIMDLQRAVLTLGQKDAKSQLSIERSLPIENAIRMAQKGASVDDLTRSCGLNIGEARLMQKMHGKIQVVASGA